MNRPLEKLAEWWEDAKQHSPLAQKNAVCLSTINEPGFPNSRFVDLKSIESYGLTFCSSYDAPKGKNINNNPKVGLTIWWDHVGYQIRVIGEASKIDENLSTLFWASRNRGAQIATHSFNQSKEVTSEHLLIKKARKVENQFKNMTIPKPSNWGRILLSQFQ